MMRWCLQIPSSPFPAEAVHERFDVATDKVEVKTAPVFAVRIKRQEA